MNTEAAAGFPAFHYGEPRRARDRLRPRCAGCYAEGARFDDALVRAVLPAAAREKLRDA